MNPKYTVLNPIESQLRVTCYKLIWLNPANWTSFFDNIL